MMVHDDDDTDIRQTIHDWIGTLVYMPNEPVSSSIIQQNEGSVGQRNGKNRHINRMYSELKH